MTNTTERPAPKRRIIAADNMTVAAGAGEASIGYDTFKEAVTWLRRLAWQWAQSGTGMNCVCRTMTKRFEAPRGRRCYAELAQKRSFRERYEYLRLNGTIGKDTFGFDRYLNQAFYRSPEWRRVRDAVIIRDAGCDLGIPGREIPRGVKIIIHHMNPIMPEDIRDRNEMILDPEYLITTVHDTHLAIHYGDEHMLIPEPVERFPGDTCPWRRK